MINMEFIIPFKVFGVRLRPFAEAGAPVKRD
jgi:hypothetical protein